MRTKHLFALAVLVLSAMILTSCGYKSEEAPLGDTGLKSYTAKTDKNEILYGVKDAEGKVVLSAQYESVRLFNENLIEAKITAGSFLFDLNGRMFFDKPMSNIFSDDQGNILLNSETESYIYFDKTKAFQGPFFTIKDHGVPNRYWASTENDCSVYTKDGKLLVKGDFVTYLHSSKNDKHYFVVTKGKVVTAYDTDGKELFPIDAQKIKKLPAPNWFDVNANAVSTKNSIDIYKGKVKKAKKAKKR